MTERATGPAAHAHVRDECASYTRDRCLNRDHGEARRDRSGTGLGLGFDVLLGAWGHHSLETVAAYADVLTAALVDPDEVELHLRVLDLAWHEHTNTGCLTGTLYPMTTYARPCRGR